MRLTTIGKFLRFKAYTKFGTIEVKKSGTPVSDNIGGYLLNKFGNKVQLYIPPVTSSPAQKGPQMAQIPNPAASDPVAIAALKAQMDATSQAIAISKTAASAPEPTAVDIAAYAALNTPAVSTGMPPAGE